MHYPDGVQVMCARAFQNSPDLSYITYVRAKILIVKRALLTDDVV